MTSPGRSGVTVLTCSSPTTLRETWTAAAGASAIPITSRLGEAALAAVFPTARDHMTFPDLLEQGLEPHKVAEIWIMGHPEPDHWVDVTEHMHTSVRALSRHESQVGGQSAEELLEMMQRWRRERSIGKGMQYGRGLPTVLHAPLIGARAFPIRRTRPSWSGLSPSGRARPCR